MDQFRHPRPDRPHRRDQRTFRAEWKLDLTYFAFNHLMVSVILLVTTAFFQVPLAWGALVLLSLMGIVLFQMVVIVERVFFPWAVDLDKQTV